MPRAIATSTRVDRSALLDFVRPRHRMILITTRSDGTPQASPVTGGVDGDGRIVISTYPERAKTANARRSPKVSVLVLSDEWNGAWVQVDGEAEVLDRGWPTGSRIPPLISRRDHVVPVEFDRNHMITTGWFRLVTAMTSPPARRPARPGARWSG